MEVEQSTTILCSIMQSMFGRIIQNITMDSIVQTVSGLTPNATAYTFRVAAIGIDQMIGPFSDTANVSALGKCA